MPYSIKGFFEINKDILQILLTSEVLLHRILRLKTSSVFFLPAFTSLFFSNDSFGLGSKPVQDDFQHDFARMTDEADSSVVLAEL